MLLITLFCASAMISSGATIASQSNDKKQETNPATQQALEPPDTFFQIGDFPGEPAFHIATADFGQEAGKGAPHRIFHAEFSFDGKVVEGAPYSADALTETSQTLGDGNHIVQNTTAKIYRDSAGRTRREEALKLIGAPADAGDAVMIFINDPVTGVGYNLDPKTKTAHKMPAPPALKARMKAASGAEGGATGASGVSGATVGGTGAVTIINTPNTFRAFGPGLPPPVAGGVFAVAGESDANKESLGTQTIEGVAAEGTRVTITIPAGKIGNQNPIVIVRERWYSPDLQTVVLSKTSDPRTGDITYRLTNIVRSEPDPSLFEVPADYKIVEGAFGFKTGLPGPPRIEQKKQ